MTYEKAIKTEVKLDGKSAFYADVQKLINLAMYTQNDVQKAITWIMNLQVTDSYEEAVQATALKNMRSENKKSRNTGNVDPNEEFTDLFKDIFRDVFGDSFGGKK